MSDTPRIDLDRYEVSWATITLTDNPLWPIVIVNFKDREGDHHFTINRFLDDLIDQLPRELKKRYGRTP